MIADGALAPRFLSDEEWDAMIAPSHGDPPLSLLPSATPPSVIGTVDDIGASAQIPTGSTLLVIDGVSVVGKNSAEVVVDHLTRAHELGLRLVVLTPEADVVAVEVPGAGSRRPVRSAAMVLSFQGGEYAYIRYARPQPGEVPTRYRSLAAQGIDGLVLDLRDCGGWLEGIAAESAGVLLPEGTLLYSARTTTDAGLTDRRMVVEEGSSPPQVPLVVLVNRGTGTGAQLLAAALVDNGIHAIGQRTSGRGLIRTIRRVDSLGGHLSSVIGEYFRPNGEPVFPEGINPSQQVRAERRGLIYLGGDQASDEQLRAALIFLAERNREEQHQPEL
jgi:C-terminal processing protease CtpA/Prc